MTNRREFLKSGLIGATGWAIGGEGFSARSFRSIVGSNDRINVAVIGIRGRGMAHIDAWCSLRNSHNVQIKTLCDTDEQFFASRSKMVMDKSGRQPIREWDMRRVLDDKEIDIVSLAVPNHWHALGTIWACQAGKHVFVEKPAMHNVWEGRKMIEAARKYDRRVQVGFQNRSIGEVIKAMQLLHEGGIGKVYLARGLCIKPRDPFGIAPDSAPPQGFHYDRWLGPAAYRPYNEKRSHYNWHWFWDTGNGDTGNQGPHQFDVARWGLDKNEHPVSIYSNGGLYGWDRKECAQQTPDTQTTVIKYKDGTLLEFETRGRPSNGESGLDTRIGNIFYGTDGYLELNGSTWKAYRKRESIPFASSSDPGGAGGPPESLTGPSEPSHWVNLLDAVKTGNNSALHCDIREGFYSSALPLFANISYRLDRQLKIAESDTGEKIVDDAEATAMLTRAYRPPYIVPEQV